MTVCSHSARASAGDFFLYVTLSTANAIAWLKTWACGESGGARSLPESTVSRNVLNQGCAAFKPGSVAADLVGNIWPIGVAQATSACWETMYLEKYAASLTCADLTGMTKTLAASTIVVGPWVTPGMVGGWAI